MMHGAVQGHAPAGCPLEDGPLEGAVAHDRRAHGKLLHAALKLAQLGAGLGVKDIDQHGRLLLGVCGLPAAV